jgi:hypothetical protein
LVEKRQAEQDPGAPPHRPQVGADEDADLPLSAATANTLSERCVCVDPHSGHFAELSPLIVRTNCSNFALHDLHVYSYIGMVASRAIVGEMPESGQWPKEPSRCRRSDRSNEGKLWLCEVRGSFAACCRWR